MYKRQPKPRTDYEEEEEEITSALWGFERKQNTNVFWRKMKGPRVTWLHKE